MKVNSNFNINNNINNNNVSFKGFYNNKILLKTLEKAAENGSLFSAKVMLGMSLTARPLAIMATPKTDRENKKLASAKSIASGVVNYLIMLGASLPVANAVKKIDNNPSKFLKTETISNLQGSSKNLLSSKAYAFATQLFKLGVGFVIAVPKSILTCALIPPIMLAVFHDKFKNTDKKHHIEIKKSARKVISFKGLYQNASDCIAKGIGKIIDTKPVQTLSKKFCDTNFAQHIMSMTDALLTLTFVRQTAKSKSIKQERKKPLINNSIISTALCIIGGYGLNGITQKQTDSFIEKFKAANKDLPNLEKYVQGIKIAKPVLLLAGIYYIAIPLIATFFAERTGKSN